MQSKSRITTITLNPAIDMTLTIPEFAVDSVNRVQNSCSDAGGKGVNVAAFLADYGFAVTATGFLGEENPHKFEAFFQAKHINDQFVRIAGSTRTGIKIIDPSNHATTDINFPGQSPTQNNLHELSTRLDVLADDCDWFVLAGSIPTGMPSDIYREMIKAIQKKSGRVALDTSGEGFRQAISAVPSLVKPNIDELQEFCGHALDTQAEVIDTARQLLDQGLETIVVSMGKEGALFIDERNIIQAIPPAVTVKSTVGAGDAMLSGMVVGMIEKRSLASCARLATAFSVVAVTHIGAGLPPNSSLKSIEEKVTLNVIKG